MRINEIVFSYIIPFANANETILETLNSIVDYGQLSELVLVDDCSTDGTSEIVNQFIKLHKDLAIIYIRNCCKLGAAESRNIGANRSTGNILVFVDADIILSPSCGNTLQKYFASDDVQLKPDVVMGKRSRDCYYQDVVSMYKNHWTSFKFSHLSGWIDELNSSFFAIKREPFFYVNGFRQLKTSEDSDLGYRLISSGHRIYFADDILVIHKKYFSLWSLIKRDYVASRNGIQVKKDNRRVSKSFFEGKFFMVGKNFFLSVPISMLALLSLSLGIVLFRLDLVLLFFFLLIVLFRLNYKFLCYSIANHSFYHYTAYILIIVLHLNVIAAGMTVGMGKIVKRNFVRS